MNKEREEHSGSSEARMRNAGVPTVRPLLYSVGQTAKLLNRSQSTIYAWMKDGTIEWRQMGASRMPTAESVHRIAEHGTEPKARPVPLNVHQKDGAGAPLGLRIAL